MSNYPVGQPPRSADPHATLRLTALTAVVAGVVLLAAAAFVLSYSGIHQIALQAGVSPGVARIYPVIFDAMIVVAGAAAMALRGAGWWPRLYAWAALIVLLVMVAAGNAVHATRTALPAQPSRAAVAVIPWVLLLLAFGLLLEMLQHFRKARAAVAVRQAALADAQPADRGAAAQPDGAGATALSPGAGATALPAGTGTTARPAGAGAAAAARASVTWAGAGAAGTGGQSVSQSHASLVDMLLGPRPGQPPAVVPYEPATQGAAEDASQQHDPVSYGEETGYVHPESYRAEGEYSPHGDAGGPVALTAPGGSNGEVPAAAAEALHPGAANGSGDTGQAGEPEPAAETGSAGETAPAGETGAPKEIGPAGETAPDGETGALGETGPAGETAPAGDTSAGQTGETAPPGESGPPGETVASGDPGAAGERGQDAAAGNSTGAEDQVLERMHSTPARPEGDNPSLPTGMNTAPAER